MSIQKIQKTLKKSMEFSLYIWIFLLPLQTRYIFSYKEINGGITEFGTKSVYLTEIILGLIFVLFLSDIILSQFTQEQKHIKVSSETMPLIGMLVVAFVSIYFSIEKSTALLGFIRLSEASLLFFIVQKKEIQYKKVIQVLCISASLVAVFGIVQFLMQYVFASTWIGVAMHDPSILGDSVVETETMRFLRVYGTLPHPNMFGSLMGIGVVAISLLWKEQKIFWKKFLTWISLVLLISGIILSGSRSAWMALLFTGIFTIIWQIYKKKFDKKVVLQIIGIIFTTIFVWFLLFPEFVQTRLMGEQRLEQKSTEQRIDNYKDAKNILGHKWVQGVGMHSYIAELAEENKNREAWEYQPIHNIYVQILVELGVFGLVFYLLFLFEITKKTVKENPKNLVFIVFIVSIGFWDHFWWTLPWGMSMLFLFLGISAKSLQDKEK